MKKYLMAMAVLILVVGHAEIAVAGTGTSTVNSAASCTVVASIKAVVGSTLSFGTIARSEGPYDANSIISVTLTRGTDYKIAIDGGANGGTTGNNNRSVEEDGVGTATLAYALYTDSPGGTAWNVDTEYPTTGYNTSANGFIANTTTVYGRISSIGGSQATGGYTDTVLVTVNTY